MVDKICCEYKKTSQNTCGNRKCMGEEGVERLIIKKKILQKERLKPKNEVITFLVVGKTYRMNERGSCRGANSKFMGKKGMVKDQCIKWEV